MALKLKIRADLEREMEILVSQANVRSKTEYINRAIQEYNQKLKREIELAKLKNYFKSYQKEGQKVLHEFSQVRRNID